MILKQVAELVPVATQAAGFTTTAMSMYNSTTPLEVVKQAAKSIIVNCTPPLFKYPTKCLLFFGQLGLTIYYKGSAWPSSVLIAFGRQILI